jgi:hypothetical protein
MFAGVPKSIGRACRTPGSEAACAILAEKN